MITIDGSHGEGGGQILRTALSLAAITKTPVTIENVRRGRKKPGLQPQHLTGVRAVASICRGTLNGDSLFSDKLIFEPGDINAGIYDYDVSQIAPSAGSATMVLQQVLPVLLFAPDTSYITVVGGTNVPLSPSAEFIKYCFLPTIARTGVNCQLELQKWGFFPIGGGTVKATVHPIGNPLNALSSAEKGQLKKVTGYGIVANLPHSVAEREIHQAGKLLAEAELASLSHFEIVSVPSPGTGNAFFLLAEYDSGVQGFSSIGELGKPAEKVAAEAVAEFLAFNRSPAAMEKHLGDQLLPYLALAKGRSTLQVSELSPHIATNIWAIEQLLPVKFEVNGNSISVEGMGKARI
ncbi:MAG TPA: RNA 3'-terminal phosphate cyclase [Candidatus Omnitrophota bacterium]|nr:RNA 3'-terminal phosphate cyclase [Candidatus Omnitrophota bacterium]